MHQNTTMKKLLIPLALLTGVLLMGARVNRISPNDKLRYAEGIISHYYVDTLNEDKIVESAIVAMLKKLDPHSSYTNAEETRAMSEPLEGSFSGVGISFNMNTDTLYVLQTVSGGPSEKVGILPGDRIIQVNDTVIAGVKMPNSRIMKLLRGPKGSEVDVKVLRRNIGKPDQIIDFRIKRDNIPIHSVDAAYMADKNTGYIRLNKFAATTSKEVAEAISKLKSQGMKDLILDLTDNGGGYLSAAIGVLSELLPQNTLAVYTEGVNSPRADLRTKPAAKSPLMVDGRVVVLVNQYSASASEIVAGALQDWDRGVIVGRRSFGKGLVQRPFPFPDGSMIRLTTSYYYTPSGRNIQKPFKRGESDSYANDIMERFNHGELMHADSIHYADSLRYNTLRLNRPIYGGGGISPDRFVPLDTMPNSQYYRNLMAKGVINQYAIQYTDKNRKNLKKKYRTPQAYMQNFNIDNAMLHALVELGTEKGVKYDQAGYERAKDRLVLYIKSIIGRDIYGDETFYRLLNQANDIYAEALRLLESNEYDRILSTKQPTNTLVTSPAAATNNNADNADK